MRLLLPRGRNQPEKRGTERLPISGRDPEVSRRPTSRINPLPSGRVSLRWLCEQYTTCRHTVFIHRRRPTRVPGAADDSSSPFVLIPRARRGTEDSERVGWRSGENVDGACGLAVGGGRVGRSRIFGGTNKRNRFRLVALNGKPVLAGYLGKGGHGIMQRRGAEYSVATTALQHLGDKFGGRHGSPG